MTVIEPDPSPEMFAEDVRASLHPRWHADFNEGLKSFSRDPDAPLLPFQSEDDPPFSRCGVLLALEEVVELQLADGATDDVRKALAYVEVLLTRFAPPVIAVSADDSIWNGVGACFLENLLPARRSEHELVVGSLGATTRATLAENDPWRLAPREDLSRSRHDLASRDIPQR